MADISIWLFHHTQWVKLLLLAHWSALYIASAHQYNKALSFRSFFIWTFLKFHIHCSFSQHLQFYGETRQWIRQVWRWIWPRNSFARIRVRIHKVSPTMVNCLWVLLIAAGVASAVEVSVAIRQILTFELFLSFCEVKISIKGGEDWPMNFVCK